MGLSLAGCGPSNKTTVEEKGGHPASSGACSSGPTSVQLNYFLENPRTSSGNGALAFSSTLTTNYTVGGTLSGLRGNCLLESDRFSLTIDHLYSAIATTGSANQAYAPTRPEFRQLNSFYYATKLRDLMASLGADLSSLGRVNLIAHCNYADNAFYSPGANAVCLGYVDQGGGQKVWAADDADVVIHESGHAINHALASTAIMNSSGEAGALDEAIADYWAQTILGDAQLAEWFLGALGLSYVRDATQNHLYPASMIYEVHDDSRPIAELLWDLRQSSNLGSSTTDRLIKTSLELLPGTTRFADFYQAVYDASGPAFLNLSNAQRSLIVTKFTNKGIHRADDATGLRLSTTGGAVKQVYVIDDHTISAQSGGNCNGQLDVGETALVLVNLENAQASALGMGVATLGAAPAGTTIPSGGEFGEFFRFPASGDFVSALSTGSARSDAIIMAAFLIRATTSGAKNFSLSFAPMYSDPTLALTPGANASVNFSLTVGAAATSTSCANSSLWP